MGEGVEERGQRRGWKEKSRGGGGRWKAGEVDGKDGAEGGWKGKEKRAGEEGERTRWRGKDGEESVLYKAFHISVLYVYRYVCTYLRRYICM